MMDALEWSILENEKIRTALKAPEVFSEVVKSGDLAALVPPERWEQLREIRQKREATLALVATIAGKLSEVEEVLRGLESRRPRDVSRLADQILAGEPVAAEPEPEKPQGIAAMGREQLTAAKAGLQLKKTEAESEAEWLGRQARIEEAKILEETLTTAAARYADIVQGELQNLHVIIDAGSALLSGTKSHPVLDTASWRRVRFLAPPYTDGRKLASTDTLHLKVLANFESGAGVSAATESWRRAVKAAVGISNL
jgi:hypothetical protein